MDTLISIMIGVLIGVILTACITGKAIYDTMKDLKEETKKLRNLK